MKQRNILQEIINDNPSWKQIEMFPQTHEKIYNGTGIIEKKDGTYKLQKSYVIREKNPNPKKTPPEAKSLDSIRSAHSERYKEYV